MAEPFDTLMQVQQHDTALDQLRRRKEALPERAALAEVGRQRAELDASVAEVVAQIDELAARQGTLEEHIAATARRRHDIEQRMQSGAVSASRDLQAMDHEVHQLADRQSHLEEEELVLLEEQEPLDQRLEQDRAALAALKVEAERLSVVIAEAEAEIDVAIAAEAAVRDEVAPRLPAELAARYEVLRTHLGGVGAAKLVGDRCDGCHLTLPSVEVERIRHLPPDEFATCPQCDRILVH
jgi:predicted  nucleic acid-binding Zn-ribbon protein